MLESVAKTRTCGSAIRALVSGGVRVGCGVRSGSGKIGDGGAWQVVRLDRAVVGRFVGTLSVAAVNATALVAVRCRDCPVSRCVEFLIVVLTLDSLTLAYVGLY